MLPFVRRRNQKINFPSANTRSAAAFIAATLTGVFKSQHQPPDPSGPSGKVNGVLKE